MTLWQGMLLGAGAIVLAMLVPRPRAARPGRGRPRPPQWLRRRRRPVGDAPDLAALDRVLGMSASREEDAHVRLRPLVRDIARQRLADRAGIRMEAAPEAAAAAVGPDVWALIRPDRPPPLDRRAPGIPPERLRALVESLERIGEPA